MIHQMRKVKYNSQISLVNDQLSANKKKYPKIIIFFCNLGFTIPPCVNSIPGCMALTHFFIVLLTNLTLILCLCSTHSLWGVSPSLSVSENWPSLRVDTSLKKANQIDNKLKGVDRGYVGSDSTKAIDFNELTIDTENNCECDYCSSGKKSRSRPSSATKSGQEFITKTASGFLKLNKQIREKARQSNYIEVGGVPVYSQNRQDPYDRQGYRGKYPQGYCGPTAMQMVLDYYGLKISRDFLALTDLGTGPMYRQGQGSRYAPMVEMARHLGFVDTEIVFTNKIKHIKSRLSQMRPQIVSLKGYLKYASGSVSRRTKGHIVLVTGIDESGKLIIHDPAGRGTRSLMSSKDFLRVWRGFLVDLRGEKFSRDISKDSLLISRKSSAQKEMVNPSSL